MHWAFRGSSPGDEETKQLIPDTDDHLPKAFVDEDGKAKVDAEDRFFKGVMAAVFVGITNGSSMIPLEYANKVTTGPVA